MLLVFMDGKITPIPGCVFVQNVSMRTGEGLNSETPLDDTQLS